MTKTHDFIIMTDGIFAGESHSKIEETISSSENCTDLCKSLSECLDDRKGILVVIINKFGMTVFRTPYCMSAFYYTQLANGIIFASKMKGFWGKRLSTIHRLEPGESVHFHVDGQITKEKTSIERPKVRTNKVKQETVHTLADNLTKSFGHIETNRVAILFSGGIDSSLVAHLAKDVCDEIELFTTRSEKSHDASVARDSADKLGLPLFEIELNDEMVWNVLPEVIHAIETSNRMDVEIALPFFLAAKEAADMGHNIVLSGQGPDELFAGYAKHLRIFGKGEAEKLDRQLWDEVSTTHRNNIERDTNAVIWHGLDIFFPYLYPAFIDSALEISSSLKVSLTDTPQRKRIFRQLAVHLGLPERIALREKKATQYSSGSRKMLIGAVSKHVEELKNVTNREKNRAVQDILDLIGQELGLPIDKEIDKKYSIDMRATCALTDRISRSTSNQW